VICIEQQSGVVTVLPQWGIQEPQIFVAVRRSFVSHDLLSWISHDVNKQKIAREIVFSRNWPNLLKKICAQFAEFVWDMQSTKTLESLWIWCQVLGQGSIKIFDAITPIKWWVAQHFIVIRAPRVCYVLGMKPSRVKGLAGGIFWVCAGQTFGFPTLPSKPVTNATSVSTCHTCSDGSDCLFAMGLHHCMQRVPHRKGDLWHRKLISNVL